MNRIEIETFKERVDLMKVVGHYLTLEKKGTSWLGLCPFHNDHHPSLRVDPQKGLYRCFSCGAGGDALKFVREKEGCGFMEAVRICADICHLSVPVTESVVQKHRSCQVRERASAPTIEENEAFSQTLLPYDPGMEELRETYTSFGVGIAPAVVPEAFGFTRGRIVFPIHDHTGRLVAFAGRYRGDLTDKKIPKYINSSTSAIYKKEELLYGWYRAVEKVRETGIVYLTEGYKDALAMHAAGFTNTVALCGTNLSKFHIALIRQEAATACLFLDADEVGRKTVAEVVPKLRRAGLLVVDLLPEEGKDPDELLRAWGREAFARWVRRESVSLARRETESLLVAVCHRWPDTCCLTNGGEEISYVDHIREILSYDNLLPESSLYPAFDTVLQESLPETKKLDNLYALHTDPSHTDRVRRSELIRYLFLCYLEVRLKERIRRRLHNLIKAINSDEKQRLQYFSSLQYDRNYLCLVSQELGRR